MTAAMWESRFTVRTSLAAVPLVLCFSWPAIVNGQPFFTLDTVAYLHAAAKGAYQVLGLESAWYLPAERVAPSTDVGLGSSDSPGSTPLLARSIYYGLALFASSLFDSFWPIVIFQAAFTLLAVWLTLRRFTTKPALVQAALPLAVLTPVAFVASFLMPDIYAGLAILGMAHLIIFSHRMGFWETTFWFGSVAYAALAHASHLLTLAALLPLALLLLRKPWASSRRGALLIAVALAVGFAGERAYVAAVGAVTGAEPIRPPFVTSRLIEDGPGTDYLQRTCPTSGFEACRFVRRLPMTANDFLWLKDPEKGAFGGADPDTRRRLAGEQARFVVAVALADPVGVIQVSIGNAFRQLASFGLEEFHYPAGVRSAFVGILPGPWYEELKQTPAFHEQWPLGQIEVVHLTTVLVALGYLGFALVHDRRLADPMIDTFWSLALIVVAGVFLNAAICGGLSGVFDRYQARVVWLVPLLALAHAIAFPLPASTKSWRQVTSRRS